MQIIITPHFSIEILHNNKTITYLIKIDHDKNKDLQCVAFCIEASDDEWAHINKFLSKLGLSKEKIDELIKSSYEPKNIDKN